MNISRVDILSKILLLLLTFVAFTMLQKISICRRCFFFFGVSYYGKLLIYTLIVING